MGNGACFGIWGFGFTWDLVYIGIWDFYYTNTKKKPPGLFTGSRVLS